MEDVIFENVWNKTEGVKHEAIQVWQTLFGLPAEDLEKRASEIVFVVKDASGQLVGVSTAKKVFIKQLRNYFYGVRFMVVPGFRAPGLMSKLVMQTRDFLETIPQNGEREPCIGLIALIENEGMKKMLRAPVLASGFVYIGNSAAGHHIRVYYFRGVRIA